MSQSQPLPVKLMILIALLQGFALLLLHQSMDYEFWPFGHPQWLFALYSFALIWPVMVLLSICHNNAIKLAKYSLPFALLSSALGSYVGFQATPLQHIRLDGLLFAYSFTMALATFKALMYIQQMVGGERISYAGLFLWSWRNFFTFALSLLFALCVWGVLQLWALLFKAIDIEFFKQLFSEPWFYYPAVSLAHGFGVIIFRRVSHVIDTITRIQQALMKFLLVLLVFVSILFLVALPFQGLATLWDSGGSNLILWMQALILFSLNAVYQDKPEQRPYPIFFHRFIYIGVALLPIYSVLSFYGLSLRVDQYGWSLARCWAFLIWGMLSLFAIGYVWGIVKDRDDWLAHLSRVNVFAGLLLMSLLLLINSPLLDFRKIVANDQLERLDDGDIAIEDFDIIYFQRYLAGPGYDALQVLKKDYAKSAPQVALRIDELYRDRNSERTESTKKHFMAAISVETTEVLPDQLLEAIYQHRTENSWELQSTEQYLLQSVDLNNDAQLDFVLATKRYSSYALTLYFFENDQWRNSALGSVHVSKPEREAIFLESFKAGDFPVSQPKWQVLTVGEDTLQVREGGWW